MFIRQTRTNNKITGEGYFTFRLVRGERIGGRVRISGPAAWVSRWRVIWRPLMTHGLSMLN